ncbi:outer membrane protein assembly factor BamA [Candidatus Poribacteria bacterium]|nr:outer membrane protein assembly factor BamA [Candidatus Poribacteria bacterium]
MFNLCRISAIIIFMLLISTVSIFAQDSASVDSDLIVQEIVISGLKSIDESLIRDLIQTKVGEEISPDKLSKDIKEIYKTTEAFSDISVDVKSVDNGLRVEFILTENLKVGDGKNHKTESPTTTDISNSEDEENTKQTETSPQPFEKVGDNKSDAQSEAHEGGINIIGNDKLSKKKILDKIILKSGAYYSEKGLWESTQNILELYREEGYYLADVNSDVKLNNPDDTMSVTFKITEGERVKIDAVNFSGNQYATPKELRKVMKTREGKRFRDEDFDTDLERIIDYYQDRGFMYARIVDTQKKFTDDKTGIMLDITIEEGTQFRLGKYDIIFKDDIEKPFSEEKIRSLLQLSEGDIFSRSLFAEDLDAIREAYNEKGYILAQVIPDPPKYDSEKGIVEIALNISEGSIISIGDVDINGLEKTKEPVIRRELNRLDIKTGKPYNVESLRLARQKIYTIGSFIRGVDFKLRQGTDEDQKDLVVNIIETPQTGMFSLFGGYGTEGGILGGLEVGNNNLLGKAYQVRVKGELGQRQRKTGEISFRTPWLFNDPTSLSLSLYSRQQLRRLYYNRLYSRYSDYDDWYTDKRYGGSITLGRPITKNIETSLRFRDENGYLEFPKLLTGDEENKSHWYETRSITAFVSRDTRDYRMSLFNPISGSYNSFSYEYSGGLLGADNQFQKYTVDTNWFRETFKNFILAAHLQAGYIRSNIWTDAGKVDINKIWMLSSDRYYLGGIDTMYPVRGYENWSLLPEAKGKVDPNFGGNKMYYLNLEYRYPVRDNLTLLAFYDMGQTWNEDTTNIFKEFSPRKSVGVGVRFELPAMGLIMRLEYGYGFDRENNYGQREPGGKFHFSLGPAF